jgi:RNA polymerase sigma-70 factor, ECF subfamily
MIDPSEAGKGKEKVTPDHSQWTEAYARYVRLWTRLARTTMITKEEAEDIVHGVVTSLLAKGDKQFESLEHIRNYVARSVVNRSIQFRQRGMRLVDITESAELMMVKEGRSGVVPEITNRALIDAIKKLPKNHSQIIKLRFFAGFTFKEIGEFLDLPISTLKSRELAALRNIRKTLKRYIQ